MRPVCCWRCGLLMIDGTGAVLPGLCCPCGDEVDAERKRADELEAAGNPFEGLEDAGE